MNAKRKGTRNERRSIALLEALGYRCTRAAASLGVWDIVAISATDIALCQVKTNTWPRQGGAMAEFKAPSPCRKLIHRWRDGEKYRTCGSCEGAAPRGKFALCCLGPPRANLHEVPARRQSQIKVVPLDFEREAPRLWAFFCGSYPENYTD